jgi:hypothetical protein
VLSNGLRTLLPLFTPLVVAWAALQRWRAMRRGDALSAEQMQIATAVGVAQPERIRLWLVPRVPIPGGEFIDGIAARLGLPGSQVDGLTLGHAVFVRRDALTLPLLAHEFRHVQQCEIAGSMGVFLATYVRQVARHGYRDAPLECDARAAAASAALPTSPPTAPSGDRSGPSPRD